MAKEESPNSFRDPYWSDLASKAEQKYGITPGLLVSVLTNGERSNANQVSEAKAKTPFQVIPATRDQILKRDGIDAYLSDQNAADAAALVLKDGVNWAKSRAKDPSQVDRLASGFYHAGGDTAEWGPKTLAYMDRVTGGLKNTAPAAAPTPGAPLAAGQSTFDRVMAQQTAQKPDSMDSVLQAYQSGQMTPEDAKTFEGEVNAGRVMLPRGVKLNGAAKPAGAPAMPNALAVAYQSGQMDPKDRAQLDGLIKQGVIAAPVGASQIPGQTEGAPSDVSKAFPEPTIGQKIVGGGEAALNAGLGATFGTAGAIQGVVNGMFDPNVGNLQQLSDAAAAGAARYTPQPQSPTGQEYAANVGNAMQNAVPLMGMSGEMASAAQAANALKPTVAAIPQIARNTAATAGQAVAQGVRAAVPDAVAAIPAKVGQMMGREPAAARPTPGTMGSVGAAGVDMATQRRMAANELPVPLGDKITEGMATRDFAQQRFEKETAKHPELGAPIRERAQELNRGILQNFDAMVDLTGAEAPDLRATGTVVTQALRDQLAKDKTKVRVAYKNAEKAGEMEQPVALTGFVDYLNDNAPDAAVAPLLTTAKQRALKLGIATEAPDGTLIAQPVPLKTAELGRRAISNAMGFEPTNVFHGVELKKAIDAATDGLGGDLYRAARAERSRLAENYQNHAAISDLIGTKRGTGDRQVAVEDVFRRTILNGSVDDIRQVRRVLQRSGDQGTQAWKELQGQTIKHIKDQATGSARDAAGNQTLSPHALNKAITTLDKTGKLDFVFGKKGAETLRTLNDVVNAIRTSPEGAVNTSNTAAVLLAALDMGISGAGGMPLPVASGLRLVVNNIKDRRIRARVNASLGIQRGNQTVH